ncbi:bioC [Acrasis kona]|uniref:BioC n=1 Tax=Acrasis kona TaxID=1008807 RepID=A0AAW2YTE4_9EUKA
MSNKMDSWRSQAKEFEPVLRTVGLFARLTFKTISFPQISERLNIDRIKVLDAACGSGVITFEAREICNESFDFVATDFSDAYIQTVNEKINKEDIKNVKAEVMDATDMSSIPSDTFDYIFCQFGVMFFSEPKKFFTEAARVLKPGGMLIVSTWRHNDLAKVTKAAADLTVGSSSSTPPPKKDLLNFTDPDVLVRIATEVGLKDAISQELTPGHKCNVGEPKPLIDFFYDNPVVQKLISGMDESSKLKYKDNAMDLIQVMLNEQGEVELTMIANLLTAIKP